MYSSKNEICKQLNIDGTNLTCQKRAKYGGYCYKHRHKYLCNQSGLLIEGRFTGVSKDYTLPVLLFYLKYHSISIKHIKKNKECIYSLASKHIYKRIYYSNHIDKIICIQRYVKDKYKNNVIELRGPGYMNRSLCNNDSDFYYAVDIQEIDDDLFFSYKDSSGFIWFFDIRSIYKLIDLNQDNPYTRESISPDTKKKVSLLYTWLIKTRPDIEIEPSQNISYEQELKQKCVDIFCDIQQMGWLCNIDWFFNLSLRRIKRLYKELEDIWNYRSQLTYEMKSRISPPNGYIFTTPVSDIYSYTDITEIRSIILNDLMTIKQSQYESDKKLGYMYFLIGLGYVSQECISSHNWILHT